MTIKEYRDELAVQISRLSSDLKNPISREQITGLNVALVLSEKLYETYPYGLTQSLTELMSNRQVAELLSRGYGQIKVISDIEDYDAIETQWSYWENEDENMPVADNIRIRQWGSDHWARPVKAIYDKYFEMVLKIQDIERLLLEDCK